MVDFSKRLLKNKVIVGGSRDFDDYTKLSFILREELDKLEEPIVVSGGARGADRLAERFCVENNIKNEIYRANWDEHGKSAGYKRNEKMIFQNTLRGALYLSFWDGESKGTKHMIDLCKEAGVRCLVYLYKSDEVIEYNGN